MNGAAVGEEEDSGGDESRSLVKDADDTPSWVLGGFESAEVEQENFERWQRDMFQKGKQVGIWTVL